MANTLEDLTLYESAAVASQNAKNEPGLAVASIGNFYQNRGMGEDPIILDSLQRANVGVKAGTGISDSGLVNAIGLYSKKYEGVFAETKFSDLLIYLTEGYDIPQEAREALANYGDSTITDLMKRIKEEDVSKDFKESVQKAMSAIEMLKGRKFMAKSSEIVDENTYMNLSQLYPAEKSEETE